MQDVNLYLTVMFWIYMIGLLINIAVLNFANFPMKRETTRGAVVLSCTISIFFLYWLSQVRGAL